MRILLLTRGLPASGKSTWIEKNNLKKYTISPDDIRLLYNAPEITVDGQTAIYQGNNKLVWKTVFDILEVRMKTGEFTIIDATHSTAKEINKYKNLCKEYRYRAYIVDFTNVDVDTCKRRNSLRETYKTVPDEVIDKFDNNFKNEKVPSWIKEIIPDEFHSVVEYNPIDFSNYKKIHHIGDIHGCYTALRAYLKKIKEDELYIFVGDYIDRGKENVETLKFIMSIKDLPNVILLEGNHERWINYYAHDKEVPSPEFRTITAKEFDKAGFNKSELAMFYRKLAQVVYYKYDDKYVLVTHGGVSSNINPIYISAKQLIHGVGKYEDTLKVEEAFNLNNNGFVYQIHGHRNIDEKSIRNGNSFNLEGKVEFSGDLRVVTLTTKGFQTHYTPNPVFKNEIQRLVEKFRGSDLINEKSFGSVSSFNFTREAFNDKKWNVLTTKARGLYIDTENYKIVARGYDKFFNFDKSDNFNYPIEVYVKENGFLGLVSYYNDDLFITTKSSLSSDHAKWFKEILLNQVDEKMLKSILKDNNTTLIFECIDIERDPHIIEYKDSNIILLDVVPNTLTFKRSTAKFGEDHYKALTELAKILKVPVKEFAFEIKSETELDEFITTVTKPDYKFKDRYIEGFVLTDKDNHMAKVKTHYYNLWKSHRSFVNHILKHGKNDNFNFNIEFLKWINDNIDTYEKTDIISLRRSYYERTGKTE